MGLECLSNVKRKDKILGNTSFRGWEEKESSALKTEKEGPDRSEENMEEVVGAKDEGGYARGCREYLVRNQTFA